MKCSVFIGTSVDGFIARRNDELDFLPPGGGEPHGYNEFIASVDAVVIGRKTFEKVLTMGPWAYGKKRVVVLSSRPLDLDSFLCCCNKRQTDGHASAILHAFAICLAGFDEILTLQ